MSTTHDITIASDTIVVGSTLSRISICPSVRGHLPQRYSSSSQLPLVRYEHPQQYRESIVCKGTRHYVCTLTKLHGPDGLFVMMHDRTWAEQDYHVNVTNSSTSSQYRSTTYTSATMSSRSQSSGPILAAIAPLDSDGTATTAITCSECGHRIHNIQSVQEWHRFRVEMLRYVVEERYQSLVLDQVLDSYDLKEHLGPTTARLAQERSHDKILRHHYTQPTFHRSTLPIQYPNKGCQDGYWDVLLLIDWDDLLVRTTMGSDAFVVSRDNPDLTTSSLGTDAQNTHQHYLEVTAGDSTSFDDYHSPIDTIPSSSGLRVNPLQPSHTNPRVKFPTVYEANTQDAGESSNGGGVGVVVGRGEVKVFNEGQGIPLVRHPSGEVKVLHVSSISELFRKKHRDSPLVRNNNDYNVKEEMGEDIVVTQDYSYPRTHDQVMNARRSGGSFSEAMQEPTLIRFKDDNSALLGTRTPLQTTRQTHHRPTSTAAGTFNPGPETFHPRNEAALTLYPSPKHLPFPETMTTVSTTESTLSPSAAVRTRSPKAQPYPIITHNPKSPAAPDSYSSSRSLRATKHVLPSGFDNHHRYCDGATIQQQDQDDKVGGGRSNDADLLRDGLREVVQDENEQRFTQRRNGGQFFENTACRRIDRSTLSEHHQQQEQQELHHRSTTTRQGRISISASDKWKPILATIPCKQVLEPIRPTRHNSFYFDMAAMNTEGGDDRCSSQFTVGVEPQVDSHPPAATTAAAGAGVIQIPNRTSSIASIASITSTSTTSNLTRSPTAKSMPPKRSPSLYGISTRHRSMGVRSRELLVAARRIYGNCALPSIASILKRPLHNDSNNLVNYNSDYDYITSDASMSHPSMIRDPRAPHERSRLAEKGVKFVPDHAPQSVRVGRTIELIRLARQPLEALPPSSAEALAGIRTAGRTATSLDSPVSPTSFIFWKAPLSMARRMNSVVSSSIGDPALSPRSDRPMSPVSPTTAERDHHRQSGRKYSDGSIGSNCSAISTIISNTNSSSLDISSSTCDSYEDIIFPTCSTKTARDLTISPPQSTRIALLCTVCNIDFEVTDQDSLKAFAGHVMECDYGDSNKIGGIGSSNGGSRRNRKGSGKGSSKLLSLSLSSSMSVPTATFHRMRNKFEERFLSRRESTSSYNSDCGQNCG